MLSRIRIKKLFNLYDYDIDLTNVDGLPVKYITAPNGYGKTSILDFIECLMTQKYGRFLEVPFESFEIFYSEINSNDIFKVYVKRERHENESKDSDIKLSVVIKLEIKLLRLTGGNEEERGTCAVTGQEDGQFSCTDPSGDLGMFFEGLTCHYITDSRFLKKKTDIDKKSLEMQVIDLNQYAIKMKEILASPTEREAYQSRIELFSRIINSLDFANKRMEINPSFGFRFVANDTLETKLLLRKLSSGEKHILIQFFELLFVAQEGTLVMIDEPEISLHILWQMNYSKFLEEVVSLRGFQCIVATHSPQIFRGIWSRSVDLFSLVKGTKEEDTDESRS